MTNNLLQNTKVCAKIQAEPPQPSIDSQLLKFIRRVQALPGGRHEIILTCDGGLQDWTVRTIGKVEK